MQDVRPGVADSTSGLVQCPCRLRADLELQIQTAPKTVCACRQLYLAHSLACQRPCCMQSSGRTNATVQNCLCCKRMRCRKCSQSALLRQVEKLLFVDFTRSLQATLLAHLVCWRMSVRVKCEGGLCSFCGRCAQPSFSLWRCHLYVAGVSSAQSQQMSRNTSAYLSR